VTAGDATMAHIKRERLVMIKVKDVIVFYYQSNSFSNYYQIITRVILSQNYR